VGWWCDECVGEELEQRAVAVERVAVDLVEEVASERELLHVRGGLVAAALAPVRRVDPDQPHGEGSTVGEERLDRVAVDHASDGRSGRGLRLVATSRRAGRDWLLHDERSSL
jgi:hypothetical protein